MERRRSSVLFIDQTESISSVLPQNEVNEVSAKTFLQSCPYRPNDDNHQAIIKRQEMETCLKRLSMRDDVYGVMVATMDARILYDCEILRDWIPSLAPLCHYARQMIRNLDPTDHLRALRLRTKKYEILITVHHEQLLIVMQILPTHQINVDKTNVEEDWETFLRRIEEQKNRNIL